MDWKRRTWNHGKITKQKLIKIEPHVKEKKKESSDLFYSSSHPALLKQWIPLDGVYKKTWWAAQMRVLRMVFSSEESGSFSSLTLNRPWCWNSLSPLINPQDNMDSVTFQVFPPHLQWSFTMDLPWISGNRCWKVFICTLSEHPKEALVLISLGHSERGCAFSCVINPTYSGI